MLENLHISREPGTLGGRWKVFQHKLIYSCSVRCEVDSLTLKEAAGTYGTLYFNILENVLRALKIKIRTSLFQSA
jgi:hypothetical protein